MELDWLMLLRTASHGIKKELQKLTQVQKPQRIALGSLCNWVCFSLPSSSLGCLSFSFTYGGQTFSVKPGKWLIIYSNFLPSKPMVSPLPTLKRKIPWESSDFVKLVMCQHLSLSLWPGLQAILIDHRTDAYGQNDERP